MNQFLAGVTKKMKKRRRTTKTTTMMMTHTSIVVCGYDHVDEK
tara:strand:+ start:216 stop:344 length:129 start_codon:yes stop_codon:yes gene_type:complete